MMCCDIIVEGLVLIESISYIEDDNLLHHQPNAISLFDTLLYSNVLYFTALYYNTLL